MYKILFMAENKKSFVLYADSIESIEELTDAEAGKLLKHIFRYVNDLNPETDDKNVKLAFIPIKQQLKRDLANWEKQKQSKSDAGALGNLKRWNTDLYDEVVSGKLNLDEAVVLANNRKQSHSDNSESQDVANVAVNVTVTDTVNVNEIKNKSFDDFWNLYGKKVDVKKCKAKFLKLSNKEIDKILQVVENYVKSTPEVKYRKNPLTWLNGSCWDDEIETKEIVYRCQYVSAMGRTMLSHTEKEIAEFTKSGYNRLVQKEAV